MLLTINKAEEHEVGFQVVEQTVRITGRNTSKMQKSDNEDKMSQSDCYANLVGNVRIAFCNCRRLSEQGLLTSFIAGQLHHSVTRMNIDIRHTSKL